MGWSLHFWRESAAHRELRVLADGLNRAGIAIGALGPGVLAAVDQHAAAVRDILTLSGCRLGPVELAGYARGVQDVARDTTGHEHGTGSWASEWTTLRLAAVCLLATAAPVAFPEIAL